MQELEGVVYQQEETKNKVLILRLKGRLDAISAPLLEKKIFDAIGESHHKLLLDVAEVDYLSSAGMRMLLSVSKKIKSLEGKLVLCRMTANVLDILKMSGFDHVLELTATEEDGLRRF